ncbi:hypothetical protein VTJ83DRAFT_2485 [Remersonia thermophila]|uniref:Velvet domain-containing protein n=1 Tax=Remersonia thermophila TaxID=72144 RepID=A0ABR4DIU3_9PEZI
MLAAVDLAPHDVGRHTCLDGMAHQHRHAYHEPYAPGYGGHYAPERQIPPQASQPRQLPRLPPMSTIIPPADTLSPSPVLPNGRDAHYYAARQRTYYSDYATPSPVGQTPPQLPVPSLGDHPLAALGRRPSDIRHSPTLCSTPSDRSAEEMAHELRLRQMGSFHDPHSHSQVARQHLHYPSPRSRGGSLQHDSALPPMTAAATTTTTTATTVTSSTDPCPPAGPYSSPPALPSIGRTVPPPPPPPAPHIPRSPPGMHASRSSPRQESKSMSISNLLSSSSSSTTTTTTASTTTNRHHPEPASVSSSPSKPHTAATAAFPQAPPAPPRHPTAAAAEYRITVRQQPCAARSCGFGERDRRVIDPPPIVQLTIHPPHSSSSSTSPSSELSRDEISRRLRHQFSVVHCSIWDERGERDMSSMPEDFRQQRRLMGTLVASPFVGLDEKGEEGCFFCFPDLSCRTPGTFRLKFALVVLDPARMFSGEKSAIVATAMSEPFQVYNAKDFPGMQASTLLTKRLKEQGCLISIKKGNEKREPAGRKGGDGGKGASGSGREDEDDDDEDGDAEEGSENAGDEKGRPRKKMRR